MFSCATRSVLGVAVVASVLAACGSEIESSAIDSEVVPVESLVTDDVAGSIDDGAEEATSTSIAPPQTAVDPSTSVDSGGSSSTFQIEVWADNWMAVHVDGQLIGEDSVPITTERSFNAETFEFQATTPFTLAIEAKDFKQTDSGIEYIGQPNQQMGDGGIIAQVTDLATGDVVAVTDASWTSLVVHQAPLNTECERDSDPDATCRFSIIDTPADWTTADFDDGGWSSATVWSAADVDPKDGYDQISWDPNAQLVWGTDLEVDNTVLLRTTV